MCHPFRPTPPMGVPTEIRTQKWLTPQITTAVKSLLINILHLMKTLQAQHVFRTSGFSVGIK